MVKADIKRDYYADLELPSTADTEEIKRQFRLLAKQYHPDRNPGHEVEVVPKFQAVQAAHEILIDPVEKAKYDAGRARLAAKTAAAANTNYPSDPYSYTRPTNPKPAPTAKHSPFPPPPKSTAQRPPQPPNQRPPASAGADKFNAFTRGAPSWDRAKYDEARAEAAARMFPNLRPTSSAQPMPPPPRSTPRAPTAPKSSSTSDMPHVPNVPPTSFPGMSRTASSRASYQAGDTQQGPRSAFSYVSGTRGPQQPNPHINVQEAYSMRSPPVSRVRPSVSPLRHTRSSDYDMRYDLGARPPSRYSGSGGERTDLHGDGLHRSSSVRNSPIDDRGPFGRSTARFENLPRHRSASPGLRKGGVNDEFSESSSSDDETLHMDSRPKAQPRTTRPQMRSNLSYDTSNNPGLTGQYPSTNYNRIVDESRYQYPPPEAKEPSRKPFPDVAPLDPEKPDTLHGDEGGQDKPEYAPLLMDPHAWSQTLSRGHRESSFNGFPPWAVPASVFPMTKPPRPRDQQSHMPTNSDRFVHKWNNRADQYVSNASARPSAQSTFDAAKWHDELKSDNIFRPDESQVRKSPSKTSRSTGKPATGRGRAQSRATEDPAPPTEPPNGGKHTAFQPGKLADDFAARATGKSRNARISPDSESSVDSRDRYVVVEEDAMDVDTPPTNGHHPPVANGVKPATTESPREQKRRSSHGGVDLKDFTQQAPFASTSGGLGGLKDDLETHLPFESRAAKDVNLDRTVSARIRALNLPKPPKPIVPPADDRLDKANFDQYVQNMQNYMRDWNHFNAKMIEHFRARQDKVCGTMSQNWIAQVGDGPDAESLEQDEKGDKQAGYAAYMQWLKDDAQCRDWWEEANEKHMRCLEDLGRAREAAKKRLRLA
ncbi:molecular chaperone DnaJ [Cladophialophora carrionii]|uniref:Molecular chaperone DnaJ n=1 Tax=Cladophialophora carrionii TaxID=86049 RepID=A0A1C1CFK8_9EURO|nr:molecular chaperone DnaJ [Cladophialophora carrionii]